MLSDLSSRVLVHTLVDGVQTVKSDRQGVKVALKFVGSYLIERQMSLDVVFVPDR